MARTDRPHGVFSGKGLAEPNDEVSFNSNQFNLLKRRFPAGIFQYHDLSDRMRLL